MTHAPLNRSRFPRHNGRLHANTFRRLRLALALSLTVLLTITPFNFSVRAQQSDGLSSDPETALEVKGDKILKMVHRAAAVDRASGVKGRSTTMSREARAADDDSAIDRLSRVAGIDRKSDGTVSVDLTVELTKNSDAELKAAGFAVGARIGHIATVETDVERLPELAALPSVRKMKGATYSYTTNDLARQAIKIDNASGQRVVPYTGRGVVVGIIDGGIDFRHLDFTVPGSNGQQTRIKALLDMTVYGSQTPDPGWNYSLPGSTARIGHLYTEDDINKALKVPKPANQDEDTVKERDKSGHGTHVAGIAAGNGLAGPSGNTYAGMAPEADLVIVKANRQNTSDANFFRTNDIINALKFIQQQATEMGKPFVINISLGGHIGPHDGSESHEVAVDELVSGGPLGRAVCIAAGNEGDNDIHASGYVPAGGEIELKLEAKDGTSVVSPSFFELYYPSADRFSLTITRPDGTVLGPYAYIGTNSDPFYNNPDPNIGTIFHGDDAGQHNITVVFKDSAKSLGSSWSFKLRGEEIKANGHFDVWAGYGDFQAPYVDGSRRVATPGTSRGAITVGAFVSRRGSQMPNEYAVFTSPGPTADGRPKPDIRDRKSVV